MDLAGAIPLPECEGHCGAPGAVLGLGDRLLLAFERPSALTLVRVAVPSFRNLSATAVAQVATLHWLGAGIEVTAAAVDPYTRAAVLATHLPAQPSVVYKVRVDTLMVYGLNRFRVRGLARERVHALGMDIGRRRLLALSGVGDRLLVVRLLLYAVTEVDPPLSDARGGTVLRVFGEGLPDRPPVHCVFGGVDRRATRVSPMEVRCVAPAVNATGAWACAGARWSSRCPGPRPRTASCYGGPPRPLSCRPRRAAATTGARQRGSAAGSAATTHASGWRARARRT